MDYGRCEHDCCPIVVAPTDGGVHARCLGCGQFGPARKSSMEALMALREEPHNVPWRTGWEVLPLASTG